ncbi:MULTISPECIES: DUF6603 domain-containing protein [unclassified Cryobacterium]|uniref:DUF6603 domain-containing protein n=1 Tax=unclassified Cryobacterium TaxID=2649013 RepID=UPI002AB575CF|nr:MULTISPECIES: DUF6603 domain-containing protein [unclassified Cryobacterium]MDY7528274.1 hypothetical protein [Cryobacterium sp. 10C2]MEB0286307.1 hypothetical protein [Cryobacterium sp. 10S3]MEB0290509.1 hypothetical protein [Cryobacterium sp. 10C2]MEB0305360.1 hypothetical protein [Cryobacterium sp. 10I1]WPX12016.1 hypothetical protein RHM57_09915 [Cryobacterium sp. 10S3]
MTDIGTGFLNGIEAFANSRLGAMSGTSFKDTVPFLESIVTFGAVGDVKPTFEKLKADIKAAVALVEPIAEKIKKQTELIAKMVKESADDIDKDDFNVDTAARVAVRIGMALAAMDEAFNIVAKELAKKADGTVDETIRSGLMDLWNPWAQPFKNLGAGSGKLLNSFGKNVLGVDDLVKKLGDNLALDRTDGKFLLAATFLRSGQVKLGAMTLDQVTFEAFLQFSDREIANPTAEEKTSLLERDGKWFIGDVAILGLRFRTILQPGLTSDPLLAKVMPGSEDPKATTLTTVSLDTGQGFYIGDGRGNEKAVLPTRFSFPGVELREVAFGLVRNPAREVTGFELTTSIAAKLGDVIGLQVVGSGFVVTPEGEAEQQAVFNLPVSPRWPDAIGLRVKAGPVTGGGFIQRVERTYKVGGQDVKRVEFGGVVQLQILKFGLSAIVILSPDPFSIVLVIGVRFPVAIDLSMGFTLNGIGGILALNRGLDLEELRSGMKEHILDKMLFPDNPVAEAPKLLEKVAHVFPPKDGGFVFGPIVELGWGSQAKFVEMKLGVVLALPDPMIVILGSLRVRVPTKEAPITDIRADVFVAITPDYLLLFASMRDSTVAGIKISGDLGLYIQWSGNGAFEFSVGGFHPEYEKLTGGKPKLGDMDRVTIDLSPSKAISFVIKAYFAITAGSVMLGVDGRLNADFSVIVAKAWLTLDMIFIWAPRFAFKITIEVGVEVELLGFTLCSIVFRGSLEGTKPFRLAGHIKVDVWFLPTFDEDLGPVEWGEKPPPLIATVDALQIAAAAMNEPDAWKVQLPDHAAQLVTLAEVDDVEGRIGHPLAGVEVSQTQVPLGVKIARIGSASVKADMVTIGTPTATPDSGLVGAVSELRTAFAPGQFFALEGESLLARSGFEDMTGGCRIAAATTPKVGTPTSATVAYQTYVRNPDEPSAMIEFTGTFATIANSYATKTNVGRAVREVGNPYTQPAPPNAGVTVSDKGSSRIADAATGAALLAGLGELSATQAALVTAAINTESAATATRMIVKG